MALKRATDTRPLVQTRERVGGRGGCEKGWQRCWLERPLVQILVVVANIQMGTLKNEVEKGSV